MKSVKQLRMLRFCPATIVAIAAGMLSATAIRAEDISVYSGTRFTHYKAPAGDLPTTRQYEIDGYQGAILPNGRLVTPIGTEVSVNAPKPFGMALSPDGNTLATINSGTSPFSITLIQGIQTPTPQVNRIALNATFLGITFSPDSSRFYVAGGENGNVWVGDTAQGKIIGSVNLNGSNHSLGSPLDPVAGPKTRFKGTFPGNMVLSSDGVYLYVVDQASFQVYVIDTSKIVTGVNEQGLVTEPDDFSAVVGAVKVGRYPYGIALSPDNKTLFVTNVGIFQYTSLLPANPTGDLNQDFPLCYPGAGYPQETLESRQIQIKKVDPRNLPSNLRDPQGIRCGYSQDLTYVVPGLGSPNVPESSSVYIRHCQYLPCAFRTAVRAVHATGLC